MKSYRGFTLLEMVVAISIFSLIAIISYSSLNRFLDQRDWIEERNETLQQIQIAYLIMSRDFRRISPRTVRNGFGDTEPLFIAGTSFTSVGLVNGEVIRLTTYNQSDPLSGLTNQVRVAYRLEGNDLLRVSWPVLDRGQDTPEIRLLLMSGIQSLQVKVFDASEMPVKTLNSWSGSQGLPDGIDIKLTLADERSFQWIFEVQHGQ